MFFSFCPSPACSIPLLPPPHPRLHKFPLIYLPCSLFFLSSPLPLYPFLHMLCLGSFTWLEERKGEERATLNYTCSNSSTPIQLGPTRCLPSRFTALVSVAFIYVYFLYLCLFYCLFVFSVWSYLMILGWSQHLENKDVISGRKPSTTAQHATAAQTASECLFCCSTSLIQFIICIKQPFYWVSGLVAPISQVNLAGDPLITRCVSAAYVCKCVCTCMWQGDLHALMMRDQGEDRDCQHP